MGILLNYGIFTNIQGGNTTILENSKDLTTLQHMNYKELSLPNIEFLGSNCMEGMLEPIFGNLMLYNRGEGV